MSGGRLVVLDRSGRDVKVFPLAEGLATIGSDPGCDIRLLLPTVSPHHATVVVHANQTVVSSTTVGETFVNGVGVSVCALRHGDQLAVGGRTLRWEYDQPAKSPALMQGLPALPIGERKRTRSGRRPPGETQRASMPASTSAIGKQVAIVQPQRRQTTNDQNESMQTVTNTSNSRARSSRHGDPEPAVEADTSQRKSTARTSPKNVTLNDTTKASQWIESRKTPRSSLAPRGLPRSEPRSALKKSTPLRLAVLKKAQSVHRMRVTKIQAPSKIDHTKQAAIMLMTGHTPKPKPSTPKQRPSFVVKRPSPVRGKMRSNISGVSPLGVTPKRSSTRAAVRYSGGGSGDGSPSILQSPLLPKPKKSALKNMSTKKSTRKTESIKFDLSNLENPADRSSDVVLLMDSTKDRAYESASEEDVALHYSDSSRSPSPRRSIHSRSSRILEKSLGENYVHSISTRSTPSQLESPRRRKSPRQSELESPRNRKSSRGSIIVEKALEGSFDDSQYSHRTKSLTDQSYITTIASTRKTIPRSPRSTNQNLESYSIVDLVSMDATGSERSLYGSAGSETSTAPFATPRAGRSTRANNSSLISSSTPYADAPKASKTVSIRSRNSSLQDAARSRNSTLSKRRSASLTTPENTQTRITINSTRISRASRSRSRINDSDLLLLDDDDASPKSSRRITKSSVASPLPRKTITITYTPEPTPNGTSTPENKRSPDEATTPVLSIQNLLQQSSLSQNSFSSQRLQRRRGGAYLKRKTIEHDRPRSDKSRSSMNFRSLTTSAGRSLRCQKISLNPVDNSQDPSKDLSQGEEELTTPKSAAKPIQEGVKNKHSSAKKTQSKRSLIDNLDESDFVKQLFNSPVKRKLSRSMTEFSRKKLFEDDDDVQVPKRNTIAIMNRTPDISITELTEAFTPDVFISPLSTPGNSPNISNLERMYPETPEYDVQRSRNLLRNPRTRRSIKNDFIEVAGVNRAFAKSPRNSLSDVRVKELFASSPKNDLRRVSGVKSLFRSVRKQNSPKNTLEDVRGVKELFKNSKSDDLRNVSSLKRVLRVNSPRNDLSDVRGIKRLYRETADVNNLSDVSGVHELFREPEDLETTFDQLMGKPRVRSYGKSKSFTKVNKPKQKRNAKSLHDSASLINENVEEWLENELKKCVNKEDKKSTSKSNLTRELQKLTTNTVDGNSPVLLSRSRNAMTGSINSVDNQSKKSASEIYSTHTLPIKKRSLVEAPKRPIQKLPIKKRTILHSTPMKGLINVTMNASELGRVSPIANVTAITKPTGIGLLQGELSRSTRGKISLTDDQKLRMLTTRPLSPEIRQKRSTSKRSSPKITRASRASTNKRRASLVITKKKPILSPKSNKDTPKSSSNDNTAVNPKRNRSVKQALDILIPPKNTRAKKTIASGTQKEARTTRSSKVEAQNKDISVKTPRKTRAKNAKNTVVGTKPSTQLKPTQVKTNTNTEVNEQEVKKTVNTRRKQQNIETPDSKIEEKQPRLTRNAKNAEAKSIAEKPKGKTVNKNVTTEIPIVVEPRQNRRGRNVAFEIESEPAPKREASNARKNKTPRHVSETIKDKASDIVEVETRSLRGTKSKTVTFKDETIPNGRSKIVQNVENDSKIKKGKKPAEATVKGGQTRGKNAVVENTENDTNRNVGRRTRNVQSEKSENPVKTKKNTVSEDKIVETTIGRRTRNVKAPEPVKKVVEDVKEIDSSSKGRRKIIVAEKDVPVQNTRGRKAAPAVIEAPKRGGRTKKIDEENLAGKAAEPEASTKPARRKRKVDVDETTIKETPPKRLRATRAAAALVEPAAVGRGRKR